MNIDRGHLLPNAIYNQDLDAAKATFTLTNVAPQVDFQPRSLIGPLQTNHKLVRKPIKAFNIQPTSLEPAGMHGQKIFGNRNSKQVRFHSHR